MSQSKRNKRTKTIKTDGYEIINLKRINKQLRKRLDENDYVISLTNQSEDVKQYVQFRDQYKKLIDNYGLY